MFARYDHDVSDFIHFTHVKIFPKPQIRLNHSVNIFKNFNIIFYVTLVSFFLQDTLTESAASENFSYW